MSANDPADTRNVLQFHSGEYINDRHLIPELESYATFLRNSALSRTSPRFRTWYSRSKERPPQRRRNHHHRDASATSSDPQSKALAGTLITPGLYYETSTSHKPVKPLVNPTIMPLHHPYVGYSTSSKRRLRFPQISFASGIDPEPARPPPQGSDGYSSPANRITPCILLPIDGKIDSSVKLNSLRANNDNNDQAKFTNWWLEITNFLSKALRMRPSNVQFTHKIDKAEAKFLYFYLANLGPGQSILKTNPWLNDFVMVESEDVLSAILSIAAIYISDYLDDPSEILHRWINRFNMAETRLKDLLKRQHTASEARELITIASILSMQDIIFTERRHKPTRIPRWLERFNQCEPLLETLDKARCQGDLDSQPSSLHISQIVVVGRGIILPQLMATLPPNYDPRKEARFGWLLCGSTTDIHEIHGGCGFSRRLLHYISKITNYATRLHLAPGSNAVEDAKILLSDLRYLRQQSAECKSTSPGSTETPQPIDWIRTAPQGHIITEAGIMTEVTAEAWRITAMIYLQCRVLKLSRWEKEVVGNLSDLAHCIRITPTSGYIFTAQAPLVPAFFLGMLGTPGEHRPVARTWFEGVVSAPVTSNARPLYKTLGRIWAWIDSEPLDHSRGKTGWWEQLVQRIYKDESEIICLV
ncbi:fungal-specific transcription factor domain-containing protein [Trichoderma velutinum]